MRVVYNAIEPVREALPEFSVPLTVEQGVSGPSNLNLYSKEKFDKGFGRGQPVTVLMFYHSGILTANARFRK